MSLSDWLDSGHLSFGRRARFTKTGRRTDECLRETKVNPQIPLAELESSTNGCVMWPKSL